MIALSDRAFVVSFAELKRWSVNSIFEAQWYWPQQDIQPLSVALTRKAIPVDRKHHDFANLQLVTLHFDGSMEPRNLNGQEDFKGSLFFADGGDVIYSKIDVRNGAIGIVPNSLPRVAVSNEYPVYAVNGRKAVPQYIQLLFHTPQFRRVINSLISGASGRKRVQPEILETIHVPLPSRDVQQAIVDYWHMAQREVTEAQSALRQVTADLNECLLHRAFHDNPAAASALDARYLVLDWRDMGAWDMKAARAAAYRAAATDLVAFREFAEEATELAYPMREPDVEWPVFGVNNKVGVVFSHEQKGRDFNAPYKRIRKDWFFHNPTRSAVGSLGIVPEVPEDAITSPEYQVWRIKDSATDVLADYVAVLITTPFFIKLVRIHRVGAVKQRLYVDNLLSIYVPRLPLDEQRRFADARTGALSRIRRAQKHLTAVRSEVSEMILGTRPVPTPEASGVA